MESKYITRYKKTLSEEIEEAYGVPAYLPDKLERLRNKLIYSLRRDFEKNPGSIGPYNLLKKALRECLILQERSVKASKFYINVPEKEREDVLAVFYSLDEAVGDLIELLLDNWQEAEKPEKYMFPIEWNVAKPLMQLVRENARFTVHYQSMQHRLNAAKINAPQPAATIPVTLSNKSELVSIEEYLSDKCSLDICDKAAKKIGLSVNKGVNTFANLRIHSLAEALKETYSLKAKKGFIDEVRLGLACRYGIENYRRKYSPQHSKSETGRNAQWDSSCKLAKESLLIQYNTTGKSR